MAYLGLRIYHMKNFNSEKPGYIKEKFSYRVLKLSIMQSQKVSGEVETG